MKLKVVHSGGQTGADRTSLEEAKRIGLETAGVAPMGWKTDAGAAPELGELFGLTQAPSSDYKVRTYMNVANTDATVWFGKTSPGYWCTFNACMKYNKKFFPNPSEEALKNICDTFTELNFAGNRRRLNPAVIDQVKDAFKVIERLKNG